MEPATQAALNTQIQGIGNEDQDEAMLKFLSFMVDGDVYAFDALMIKEIIEYTNITQIPMVPHFVRGVTNLRGSVVPVIDLSARIGKRVSPVTKRTCIVIVEVQNREEKVVLGVVIDAINEVFNIRETEIEPAPSFGAGIRADFLSGMGKVNEKFVVILNVENVLSVSELCELVGQGKQQSVQAKTVKESMVDEEHTHRPNDGQ